MHIMDVRLATPATMDRDAYREFCWGAGLPETTTGYGLIRGSHHDGTVATAILDNVDYVRLLRQSSGVQIPAAKIIAVLDTWPNLQPDADSVWD